MESKKQEGGRSEVAVASEISAGLGRRRKAKEIVKHIEKIHREREIAKQKVQKKTDILKALRKELSESRKPLEVKIKQGHQRWEYVIKRRYEGAIYETIANELKISIKQVKKAARMACWYAVNRDYLKEYREFIILQPGYCKEALGRHSEWVP